MLLQQEQKKNYITLTYKSGVYKLINKATGDFYIGSSKKLEQRVRHHFYLLKRGRHCNKFLQSSFDKNGIENFTSEVLEWTDQSKLLEREQYWIDTLKPRYNLRLEAQSNKGLHCVSEEAKQKLRQRWLGVKRGPRTEEHQKNLSLALKGKTKGRKKPEGFRERLSKARMGENNPAFGKPSKKRKQIKVESIDGSFEKIFDSVTLAVKEMGFTHGIHKVLKNKQKKNNYNGFKVTYL